MCLSGPTGRVVLLAALVMVGCAKEEVVHQLTEFEANQIVYVLEAGGIKAQKEREEGGRIITYKVIVSGADAQDARKSLVDNQLPRPKEMTLDRVYDPANKGLIPTATEEEAGWVMAVQGEVAKKLKSIPGIVEAHVTIVKPKHDVVRDLADKPPPATASVTITYNQVNDKMPFSIEAVQRLVAASVESLEPQNVNVLASLNVPTSKRVIPIGSGDEGTTDKSRNPKLLGVALVDDADKRKLSTILAAGGGALALAVLGVLVMLVMFVSTRKKLTSVNGQLMGLTKARQSAPPPA